jgi:hypothetical protein
MSWRNTLASKALIRVRKFLVQMPQDEIIEYVAWALKPEDLNYRYLEVTDEGVVRIIMFRPSLSQAKHPPQRGVFQTPYIIETLASHDSFSYKGMKIDVATAQNRPRGALALVLAAVSVNAYVSHH